MNLFPTLTILIPLLLVSVGVSRAAPPQVCRATFTGSFGNGRITANIPPDCYFAYVQTAKAANIKKISAPWLRAASSPAAIIYLIVACVQSSSGVPESPCGGPTIIPELKLLDAGSELGPSDGNLRTPGHLPFPLPADGAVGFVTTDYGETFITAP